MPVSGPTGGNAPVFHDYQPVPIREGKILIAEFGKDPANLGQLRLIEWLDR